MTSMPNFSTVKPIMAPMNEWVPNIGQQFKNGEPTEKVAFDLQKLQERFGQVGKYKEFELNKIFADVNNFKDHNSQICGLLVSISKA